ncbi:flagellar protein FliL [Kurthia zopfii]|uniref:Flagellar protein FliL n=1 Tax=Kurthia zopfii TaxID=1650 RepID=A0A2U3AA35_9BACL|nr:flagellar basal body-associated protein FliL [Kurthia zopfii]PWI21400.1 flagellar basal body-associated protein FliL [Kurthia zopfii]TDR41776.1 flagellar FliL protein [Kurthia zopfii]STX09087.1 flagellar basal body-associated protein FliL [Kurthia zopfii]VEI04697.1 flagellar basal body-associated protein FliL [Kurthia zopfii]GEK30931.1 flagellar protein FliL [Kurthia zopfii]
MKNNKLLTIMLIILVSITLIGVVALVVVTQFSKDPGSAAQPSIDEIIEQSVDVPELSTNLSDKRYVKLSLKIQTDSKEAAEEIGKRDFQVKNILVELLSDMSSKDLEGQKGKELLTNALKAKFNSLMQNGEVQKVYITSFAIS